MKNLKLLNQTTFSIDTISDVSVTSQSLKTIYILEKHRLGELSSELTHKVIDCTTLESLLEKSRVVHFSVHHENNSVVTCLESGEVICTTFRDGILLETEVVGCIEQGIKAVEWSPEQDLLVLITMSDSVILMTSEFDTLREVQLHTEDFGQNKFIQVGWGKKETQFHGSEGKAAAKFKIKTDESLPRFDDQVTRISWRNDGEYFAISSVHPSKTKRYIKIYDRECVLQSTSEEIPGLESAFHWYSGKLMASPQRFPNKHVICFIEKNGLKHGELILPVAPNQVIVRDLLWNEDGRLLLVVTEEIVDPVVLEQHEKENKGRITVQLFTRGNYHWYCKASIGFSDYEKLISVKWDIRQNNMLHIFYKSNDKCFYSQYLWSWYIHSSTSFTSEDEKLTCVIDGCKLLITSFIQGITPPPMSTCTLTTKQPIVSVVFPSSIKNSSYQSNDLLVQLSDGSLNLYKYSLTRNGKIVISYELVKTLSEENLRSLHNFVWVGSNLFCTNIDTSKSVEGCLAVISLDNLNDSFQVLARFKSPIYWIAYYKNADKFYIQEKSGDGFNVEYNSDTSVHVTNQVLTYTKKDNRYFTFVEVAECENEYFVIGLDIGNFLFINGTKVANNVTSFLIHDKFLLLTTLENRLLCLRITSEIMKAFEGKLSEFSGRNIERGARLVSSITQDTRVILQMPRGNLECIQPRTLSIDIIGRFLDEKKYSNAFDIMRKQRINLNLIYDHNPEFFLSHIDVFIDQVKNPSWISLFLSELSEEDVTRTMYAPMYPDHKTDPVRGGNKVNLVCDAMCKSLSHNQLAEHLFLPILTCHIKKGKVEDIETALLKIKEVKELEISGKRMTISSDEALKYILYMIDVEELFKIALGLYDFDLVLLVVKKSQKDPQEYLPFLNELRKLEIEYQKFTIDKHLKRYEKALIHILKCSDKLTECLSFIKTHKLYRSALNVLAPTSEEYKVVSNNYADELIVKTKIEEAGIMYVRAGNYEKALIAFSRVNDWREAITCAKKLQHDSEKMEKLYTTLLHNMKECKRYEDAAKICFEYLKDEETGLVCLCAGKHWSEAFRMADLFNKTDSLEKIIIPSIIEHYRTILDLICSKMELFQNQKSRLAIVREKKSQMPEENFIDEQDMYSDTSTVNTASYTGSRSSNRSYRSAKNKRKHERKVLSLKEGNPYEDLALVAALHQHVTLIFNLKLEIKELITNLLKIEKDHFAQNLQLLYSKALSEVETSLNEIWTQDLLNEKSGYGPEATSNQIAESFQKGAQKDSISIGLEPYLKISPRSNTVNWQSEILK